MLTLNGFRLVGREQAHAKKNPFTRLFTQLFGPIGLHSRIRAGHVIHTIQRLDLPPRAKILDAGCGHALVLFWLAQQRPDAQYYGIEVENDIVLQNRKIAQEAKIAASMTLEQATLPEVDLGVDQYDLIFSMDVLEHIVDDMAALSVFRQALKPSGYLVLHLPLRHQEQMRIFPAFKRHVVHDHVRDEYLPQEMIHKLEHTDFEVLNVGYGFGWPGELAFELNNLFWNHRILRAFFGVLTYPIAWWLAYWDVNTDWPAGNSFIIVAK